MSLFISEASITLSALSDLIYLSLLSTPKDWSILSSQTALSFFFLLFLFSVWFISTLDFIISLFLLTLVLFVLYLVPWDVKLVHLFEIFLSFFNVRVYCYKLNLLVSLLLHPLSFGMLCFHFYLSWDTSKILFDFIIDPMVVQECVVSTYLWILLFSYYYWFVVSFHCGQKRSLEWFLFS